MMMCVLQEATAGSAKTWAVISFVGSDSLPLIYLCGHLHLPLAKTSENHFKKQTNKPSR